MERLTERIDGTVVSKERYEKYSPCHGCKWQSTEYCKQDDCTYGSALDRLAAYESTGLEPEDILSNIKTLSDELNNTFEELKEYRKLEEQGLLIKLPPIKKDTLYWIWGDRIMPVECKGIDRGVVYKMVTKEDRTFNKFDGTPFVYEKGDIRFFYADDIGKTVFLTQEEAEKALEAANE